MDNKKVWIFGGLVTVYISCPNGSGGGLFEGKHREDMSNKCCALCSVVLVDFTFYSSVNIPLSSVLNALEVLPVAPPPTPRQLTEEETQRLAEHDEGTFRELRLFLRDVTNRLSQDKRFKAFTKPVDLEEVTVPL